MGYGGRKMVFWSHSVVACNLQLWFIPFIVLAIQYISWAVLFYIDDGETSLKNLIPFYFIYVIIKMIIRRLKND
jgi:hypothetical protein